jgi:hypothetical protein
MGTDTRPPVNHVEALGSVWSPSVVPAGVGLSVAVRYGPTVANERNDKYAGKDRRGAVAGRSVPEAEFKPPRWLATRSLGIAVFLTTAWLLLAISAMAPGLPMPWYRILMLAGSVALFLFYVPTFVYLWLRRRPRR